MKNKNIFIFIIMYILINWIFSKLLNNLWRLFDNDIYIYTKKWLIISNFKYIYLFTLNILLCLIYFKLFKKDKIKLTIIMLITICIYFFQSNYMITNYEIKKINNKYNCLCEEPIIFTDKEWK